MRLVSFIGLFRPSCGRLLNPLGGNIEFKFSKGGSHAQDIGLSGSFFVELRRFRNPAYNNPALVHVIGVKVVSDCVNGIRF